jgi:4-hydroxy-tetrahydrodipicolinate synthase
MTAGPVGRVRVWGGMHLLPVGSSIGVVAGLTRFVHGNLMFAPWLALANFEAQPRIGLALRKKALRLCGVLAESEVRPMPPQLAPILRRHLGVIEGVGVR